MRTLIALLGFILGCLAGIVLLAVNPFAGSPVIQSSGQSYSFVTGDVYGMPHTVRRMLNLDWLEPNKRALQAPAVKNSAVSLMMLRDTAGAEAAYAVKISIVDDEANLYTGKTGHYSYWTVFWPNQGAVLMHGYDEYWDQITDGLLAGLRGRSFTATADDYRLTRSGAVANSLQGMSGIFSGRVGSYSESQMNSGDDGTILQGELAIQIN